MRAKTVVWLRGIIAIAFTLVAALSEAPAARAQSTGTGMFNAATLDTASGAEIYRRLCQGCHMPDGHGAKGAGMYPSLARDPALASLQYMALTILKGRRNMPAFAANHDMGLFFATPALTDEQIAAVINYVRSHFGNRYTDLITAAQVEALNHPR